MLKWGAPITRANTSIRSRSILQILNHRSQAEGPNNRLRVHIVMGCRRGAALRRSYNQHANHVRQVSSCFLPIGITTSDSPLSETQTYSPNYPPPFSRSHRSNWQVEVGETTSGSPHLGASSFRFSKGYPWRRSPRTSSCLYSTSSRWLLWRRVGRRTC